MFNPTVLLFGLVFALGLFGTGVSIGVKWERRDALANLNAVQIKAIDDANTAVGLAVERTLASAKKETAAKLAYRERRHKGELDAAKKSRPECARDAESIGLLNDAIRTANGEAPPGTKLPDEVRPATGSGGWLGTVREAMGIRNDRDGGGVPPHPQ